MKTQGFAHIFLYLLGLVGLMHGVPACRRAESRAQQLLPPRGSCVPCHVDCKALVTASYLIVAISKSSPPCTTPSPDFARQIPVQCHVRCGDERLDSVSKKLRRWDEPVLRPSWVLLEPLEIRKTLLGRICWLLLGPANRISFVGSLPHFWSGGRRIGWA